MLVNAQASSAPCTVWIGHSKTSSRRGQSCSTNSRVAISEWRHCWPCRSLRGCRSTVWIRQVEHNRLPRWARGGTLARASRSIIVKRRVVTLPAGHNCTMFRAATAQSAGADVTAVGSPHSGTAHELVRSSGTRNRLVSLNTSSIHLHLLQIQPPPSESLATRCRRCRDRHGATACVQRQRVSLHTDLHGINTIHSYLTTHISFVCMRT